MKLQRYSINKNLQIKENLENLYRRKGVYVAETIANTQNNTVYLNTRIFYSTDKILRYKRNIKSKRKNKKPLDTTKLFNNKKVSLSTTILNTEIDKKYAFYLFNDLQRFIGSLFSKRYTLFFDLIKVTCLAAEKKENLVLLTKILATTFRFLPKKKHNLFLSFLKQLSNIIIIENKKNLLGIKITINGKLQGKERAKSVTVLTGSVSVNALKDCPVLSKAHIYTLYGAYGLQILATYKN